MVNKQKEIQSYIFVSLILFGIWANTVYDIRNEGREYSIQMEEKTGKHWIQDLKGNPLGDY